VHWKGAKAHESVRGRRDELGCPRLDLVFGGLDHDARVRRETVPVTASVPRSQTPDRAAGSAKSKAGGERKRGPVDISRLPRPHGPGITPATRDNTDSAVKPGGFVMSGLPYPNSHPRWIGTDQAMNLSLTASIRDTGRSDKVTNP